MATSPLIGATIAEVNREWTWREVIEAHVMIDASERVAEYRRKHPPKPPKRGGRGR